MVLLNSHYRLLLAVLLVCCVGLASATLDQKDLKTKSLDPDKITEQQLNKTVSDFQHKNKWDGGKVESTKKTEKTVSVSVTSTIRPTGGITVELFCEDNTGRYMPIWGGSITKTMGEWDIPLKDIGKQNVDGCYFGVVDSTAEMMR